MDSRDLVKDGMERQGKLMTLNANLNVYNVTVAKKLGLTSSILLVYLANLMVRESENQHSVTVSDKEICQKCGITKKQLILAKKKLAEINILHIKRRGLPARTCYEININALESLLSEKKR